MDPLQWMGAVRMRVQTADKNITISTSNPHHSNLLIVSWSRKLHVYRKQIHYYDVFNFKPLLKYESSLSCLNQERNMQINRWTGVDYLWIIAMFLSNVWTLVLTAPIHCRGTIDEQVMWCDIFQRNKLIYILDSRSTFSFWVNYFFNWLRLM